MAPNHLSRRQVLRDLGFASALVPFIPVLDREREAKGAPSEPRRLVLVWVSNAPVLDRWTPQGTETKFTLGPILAPLEAHKSKMLVLGGINKIPGREEDENGTSATVHTNGCCASWTGQYLARGNMADPGFSAKSYGWPRGPSVDQVIARRRGWKTLELGVMADEHSHRGRMIYRGADQPLQPENDPYKAFDRIFSRLSMSEAERNRLRAEERSVLDFVKADLRRAHHKIGRADQQKMELHLEAIAGIEKDLAKPPAACGEGRDVARAEIAGKPIDHMSNGSVPAVWKAHNDLIGIVLACNLAQIVSLQVSRGICSLVPRWPEVGIEQGVVGATSFVRADLHSIGHHVKDKNPAAREDARDKITRADTWFSKQVAYLLDQLEARGVMKNTLVVYDREMSDCGHRSKSIPYVLFEGCQGYFKTGRFVDYDPRGGSPKFMGTTLHVGQPHTKLLVSLCHAMGLPDVETFGDKDLAEKYGGQGPLANLT